MQERHHGSSEQRYLYNGMEQDLEVSGNGNSYTTEFRQYDPRLMRWKSLDPLMAMFPWQSPYVAFDNNPVYYNDPNGLSSKGVDPEKAGIPSQTEDANGNCKDWEDNDSFYNVDTQKLYRRKNGEWIEHQQDVPEVVVKSNPYNQASDSQLFDAYIRGVGNALANANSIGVSDYFGWTDNADEYSNYFEKRHICKGV